jgi:hypothetical protein
MRTKWKTYPLDQSPLFRLRSRSRLCRLLSIDGRMLRHLSKHAEGLYREKDVPKRDSQKLRHIEDPHRGLKIVQTRLSKLLSRITPPDYLFCPVKGRDYIRNAAQHRGNRVVRCLDIRKFFPSTSARRVFWFFHQVMECDRDIAATLSRLACYKEHLPTGSPLSPILAYFAHVDVWTAIAAICKSNGYTLTVYIDDVTISGASVSAKVIWDVKKEIHRAGHRYHKEKLFVDGPAEITGVIVIGNELVPPNRQQKKIRESRKALKERLNPRAARNLQNKLIGLKGQIKQIRTEARFIRPLNQP